MDRNGEIAEKRGRLKGFLKKEGLGAVVLSSQAAYSWYTGGGENRVVMGTDGGAAFLFATGEEDAVVTTNIEAVRIEAEDLAGTEGFRVVAVPWHEEERIEDEIDALAKGKSCAAEGGLFGLAPLPGSFEELTYQLTEREKERYRALGRDCAEALEEALMKLTPGVTEHEVAARMSRSLLARGVLPHVLLVAADERTRSFRHPLATSRRAESSVMAIACGKRGGLIASLTRMIHFGKVPDDLARRHGAVCRVDAAFIKGTKPGRTAGEVFADGVRAYEEVGFPEEWREHHQGGPTGYQGRSYKGRHGETRLVLDGQAFAWNPSICGTKSEDTVLVSGDSQEVLTAPASWPVLDIDGLKRSDILVL